MSDRDSIGKPELAKLQQIMRGLEVAQVFGERILVEPVAPLTKGSELEQKGLLYMPETAKESNTPLPSLGIILAVGNGVPHQDEWADPGTTLQPGSMVLFSRYAGIHFKIDYGVDESKQFIMLDLHDVCCTLRAVTGKTLDDIVQEPLPTAV